MNTSLDYEKLESLEKDIKKYDPILKIKCNKHTWQILNAYCDPVDLKDINKFSIVSYSGIAIFIDNRIKKNFRFKMEHKSGEIEWLNPVDKHEFKLALLPQDDIDNPDECSFDQSHDY